MWGKKVIFNFSVPCKLTFVVVFRVVCTHLNNIMKIARSFKHGHSSDERWINWFTICFKLKWTVGSNVRVQFWRFGRVSPCRRLWSRFRWWTKWNFKTVFTGKLFWCRHSRKLCSMEETACAHGKRWADLTVAVWRVL